MLARESLIVLVEAESTFTVNVCIRLLLYLAQTYKDYIVENKIDLYSTKEAYIPGPELYVVYTGNRTDVPDSLNLSSLFLGNGKLDMPVKVLHKTGSGDILDQYISFCEIQTAQRKIYGYTQKAIDETIRICKEEGILTPFLASRAKEVMDIMFTLFDQEWVTQVHEENLIKDAMAEGEQIGRQKGRQEAREEARQEGRKEGIQEGKRDGILESLRNVMDSLGLTSEQALSALKVPASERAEYRKLLEPKS